MLVQLGIANRRLRLESLVIAPLPQRANLVHPAGLDHLIDPLVDALIKDIALGCQPDESHGVPGLGRLVIVSFVVLRERDARSLVNLERPRDADEIVWVDAPGGARVDVP